MAKRIAWTSEQFWQEFFLKDMKNLSSFEEKAD